MITEKQKMQWGLTDAEIRCEGAGLTDSEFRIIYKASEGVRKAGVFGPSIAWPGSCAGDTTDSEFRIIYKASEGVRKGSVFGPSIAWPGSCAGDTGRVPKTLAGTGKDDGGHLVGITFMGEAE